MKKLYEEEDTIAGIATALSQSGIGIIRVSGNDSVQIVSSIFYNKNKNKINLDKTHNVYYGFIYDDKKDIFLDEVLTTPMLAPRSYTGEDVVEISCHGNSIILKNILALIIERGARLAEAGEFTKRAFLNGRIDLTKAEAVQDLINSKNNYAIKANLSHINGDTNICITDIKNKIKEDIAYIEAALDDPEHIDIDEFLPTLENNVKNILKTLDKIIKNYHNGKILCEGINAVIVGLPNAGKSSLLNAVLNEERAIVTDIEGTTRDTLKETVNVDGITINFVDTAGIRDKNNIDIVEKIGIEKTKNEVQKADIIVLIFDISKPFEKEEIDLINFCKNQNKKIIVLKNKYDIIEEDDNYNNILQANENIIKEYLQDTTSINFSAKNKQGIETFYKTITSMFVNNEIDINNEVIISNERQYNYLQKARESLVNVDNSIKQNIPEDLLTIDLTNAYIYLNNILGLELKDDIIDEIFSKFCMGK